MANPLQSMTPSDAPMQAPQPVAPGGSPSQPGAGGPMQPGGPQQAPTPPPSHAQTVATLRHLQNVNREFGPILKNPDLGKSDMKSAVIDAGTKLVADRIVTPAAAVMLLSQVPTDPLDQRKWLQNFYDTNEKAQMTVLDHHASGGPTNLDWQSDQAGFMPHDPDGHMKAMEGVMTHYKGGGRG